MTEAGYRPVEIDERTGGPWATVFETDTWRLEIGYSGDSESMAFVVWMTEPDDRAHDYLQPLIDLYGLRPRPTTLP